MKGGPGEGRWELLNSGLISARGCSTHPASAMCFRRIRDWWNGLWGSKTARTAEWGNDEGVIPLRYRPSPPRASPPHVLEQLAGVDLSGEADKSPKPVDLHRERAKRAEIEEQERRRREDDSTPFSNPFDSPFSSPFDSGGSFSSDPPSSGSSSDSGSYSGGGGESGGGGSSSDW